MNWHRLYGPLHRALASGDYSEFPRLSCAELEAACASWGALHYATTCLLGWREVGKGMANWYSAGKPTENSPVLALVKHVWGANDALDYYAAWAWKPKDSGWLSTQTADAADAPSPSWLAKHSKWNNENWWRNFIRPGRIQSHDPFFGGTDSLHLSAHTGREDQTPSLKPVVRWDPIDRHCILLTEGLGHWLADVDSLPKKLPSIGEHSWHVDVFDRKTGWLGLFRQSRLTDTWFTGKHSVHMLGN
jgi:hypothetical protein